MHRLRPSSCIRGKKHWRPFSLPVLLLLGLVGLMLLASPGWSVGEAKPPAGETSPQAEKAKAQEPDPLQVLKKMCDYLKGVQQFSCQAEITEDVQIGRAHV